MCNYKTQDNVKLKANSQQLILEVDSSFSKLKIFLAFRKKILLEDLQATLKLSLLVGRVELWFGLCLLLWKRWEGTFNLSGDKPSSLGE